MPFRSPKMNSFIFGFQRFVWCPKWTPASSSSFIVTAGVTFTFVFTLVDKYASLTVPARLESGLSGLPLGGGS
jgi:hypothetical protein